MLEQLVRKFLYYPITLREDAPLPPYVVGAAEVRMDAADGSRIHGLHWPAPTGRPTILFFHGNAQSVFEWALVHEELLPLDCGLLLIDYPGYGKSTGEPSEQGLYAAGDAALAWLRDEAGVPEGSMLLFGKSLGGGVASHVAAGRSVLGVILESTFCSIPDVARSLLPFLPDLGLLKGERYDTAARLADIRAPVLVVHGTRDELIPLAQGRKLFELARDPKRLYLVEGAGHNDVSLVAGPAYAATLRRWLDEVFPG